MFFTKKITGDITQKGYAKKRTKLLAPFMRKKEQQQPQIIPTLEQQQQQPNNKEKINNDHQQKKEGEDNLETPRPTYNSESAAPVVVVENKNDLKTPSFIPVEPSGPPDSLNDDDDQGVLVTAQPVILDNIEPDSLDPDINNSEASQSVSETTTTSTASNKPEESSDHPGGAAPPDVPPHKDGPKKPRSRHRHKRHTHSEKRYHSEVRQEAVQQALALVPKQKPVPMSSKRSSAMNKNQTPKDNDAGNNSSATDDDHEDEIEESSAPEAGNVLNVILGLSDTSSNTSLPTMGAALVPIGETPPLPLRGNSLAMAAPPTRPPPTTSPSRQNSR
jgi:hypothetical protein